MGRLTTLQGNLHNRHLGMCVYYMWLPLVLDHIHSTLTLLLLTGFSNSSHDAGHNLPLFNPNPAGNLNPTPAGSPMIGLDLLAPAVAASLKPPKVTAVPFSKEITSPLQSSCLLATKEDSLWLYHEIFTGRAQAIPRCSYCRQDDHNEAICAPTI